MILEEYLDYYNLNLVEFLYFIVRQKILVFQSACSQKD